jgi:nitrite reductase/ring-hydroxylating ferredoxin subunit
VTTGAWIATVDEGLLRESRLATAYPKGVGILLIKKGATVYAVRNACAHMGCPLEAGDLTGHLVTCPCHDWRFDIRTGAMLEASELGIATYRTRVDDGRVMVELHDDGYQRAGGEHRPPSGGAVEETA